MVSLALLLACTRAPAPLPAGDPSRPDILLISIDTLRADHLSAWGYERPTSPFLDRLAAEGTRYAHARSPSPWTLPAHTTMLTGQLPWTHRVTEDRFRLASSTPVLPEALKHGGYRTGGFVSTLYVSRIFGFERGFDRFEDFGIHDEKKNLGGKVPFDRVVDEALAWWTEQPSGQPVFLFLHTYDAHYAYDPPEPFASRFDRPPQEGDPRYKNYFHYLDKPLTAEQMAHQVAQYDESIAWIDHQLQRLDQRLTAAGRTVRWVVTADHGEEFGERGSWGHAHTLYAEQLHVPLIIAERGGQGLPRDRVVEEAVGLQDVAPTIASWVPTAGPLLAEGVVLGPEAPPTRAFPAETTRFRSNRVSLYQDGLRLEWNLLEDQAELFDLRTDEDESVDLSGQLRSEVLRLQSATIELAGQPWTSEVEQVISSEGSGRVLAEGVGKARTVGAGQGFQVLPFDAAIYAQPPGSTRSGPHKAGQPTLSEAGLRHGGEAGPAGVQLDEATRKALEALGYIQE